MSNENGSLTAKEKEEIQACWTTIEWVFERLAYYELTLEPNKRPRTKEGAFFAIRKESVFRFLADKYKLPIDELRRGYHSFLLMKKYQKKESVVFERPLLRLRSLGSWFGGISTRWLALAGAVAAFIPIFGFISELAENNRLKQEEILQARRDTMQTSIETLRKLKVDDGSLAIKSHIELLAAEGKSLDGINVDGRKLSLLDVSPDNLRAIKASFLAEKRSWFSRLFFWPTNHTNAENQEDNAENQEDNCEQRLGGEALSNSLREEVFCVSLENASFRGTQLQSANFRSASLIEADFSSRGDKDTEKGREQIEAGANLTFTRFTNADLSNANFQHAILTHTKFERATLDGANFKGANLTYANFIGAEVTNKVGFICSIVSSKIEEEGGYTLYSAFDKDIRRAYEIECPKKDPKSGEITTTKVKNPLCGKVAFPVKITGQEVKYDLDTNQHGE